MTLSREDRATSDYYLRAFAGRTDVYEHFDARLGTWLTDHAALTAEVTAGAARAGVTLGAYFLGASGETAVCAVDVDDDFAHAVAIGIALVNARVRAYVEPSHRGGHVWVSVDQPAPAMVLRRALKAATQRAGLDPAAPAIEIRPARDTLSSPRGCGSALRLPMQPHQRTGERFTLTDPVSGEVIGECLAEMVRRHEFAPLAALVALAETYREPPLKPVPSRRDKWTGDSPIARFNAAVGASQVLVRDYGVANARPGRTVICPRHDDHHPSLSIARDDSRVWCKSPGCILHGPNGAGHDAWSLVQLARATPA